MKSKHTILSSKEEAGSGVSPGVLLQVSLDVAFEKELLMVEAIAVVGSKR